MPLNLLSLLNIDDPSRYKCHAARWNAYEQPLDVFVRSREEWVGWNSWMGSRNDFNRRYIVSFMDFYPERLTWLFGGIFEVLARGSAGEGGYTIEARPDGEDLVGRLKVMGEISRGRAFLFETLHNQLTISELLKEPYTGEAFVGLDNVSLDFPMLETIVRCQRPEWKATLQNAKGVYVIVDRKTGKKYVGSAYGDAGVWSR